MKFQLKALAAAAILASALPAQAATDTALSGNSSLILAVYDTTANISALFDLGKNYSDFNVSGASFANSGVTTPGTSFSWNLTSGDYAAAWSLFNTTATLPNIKYAVVAQDNSGLVSVAGNRGLISSYSATGASPTTGQLGTIAGNFDSYVLGNGLGSNVTYENHSLVANGSSVSSAGSSYAPNYFGSGKNFNLGNTAAGAIGSDLGVFQYTNATSTFAAPGLTFFGNGAKFNLASNGSLIYSTTVAAIPEADTWAMMMLGLGFMGFVARRKQA